MTEPNIPEGPEYDKNMFGVFGQIRLKQNGYRRFKKTANTLIRLDKSQVWSEFSLEAH